MDGLIVEMLSSVKGEFTGQPSKCIQAHIACTPWLQRWGKSMTTSRIGSLRKAPRRGRSDPLRVVTDF
ncbi:MAG: hypothetical protein PVF37_15735 [Desulfobacterales bacterium]